MGSRSGWTLVNCCSRLPAAAAPLVKFSARTLCYWSMLLERYYDDTLAQASYLIACEKTGDAIVIDPNRDVQSYIRAAHGHRVRIRYVTETHIHADFLSGSRDLASATRAQLLLSDHGGDDCSYASDAFGGARFVHGGE